MHERRRGSRYWKNLWYGISTVELYAAWVELAQSFLLFVRLSRPVKRFIVMLWRLDRV